MICHFNFISYFSSYPTLQCILHPFRTIGICCFITLCFIELQIGCLFQKLKAKHTYTSKKIMTRFIVILALLWCSGTKPVIFPVRYACTMSSLNSTHSLASIHLHILFSPPEPTLIHHSDVRAQVKSLTFPPSSPPNTQVHVRHYRYSN